ncbi:hypothetical protein JK320_25410 [Klebsiella pneumoniae]|uniref:hypothetical protein n=1 Tax=Klebsiella pneumoniae TaxID=573 RepID=UPI00191F3165|nr:hypothetical protein [Klebsiella pneumoniae]MBL0830558.1 hypothetical protein [Klebsiella pneumoniae]
MTDLTSKFDGLETQLSTQHSDMMNALNALLSALGAPPPSPGATLADVVGALNQLALMVAGLRTDMATQHAAQLVQLQLLNSSTDLLLQNTSWNTKQLLLGLAALDPCKQCEIPSYDLPPIDETPVTVDQEHCKRVQALLYAILRFTVKLDIISSLGAGFNVETIKAAFTEILTEVGAAGNLSISLPSFNELLTLVAACVEYIASNIFAGNDLQSSFLTIKSDLIQPLYEANTANAGIAAYRAGIDASSLPMPIKRVLKAIGYIALFNLYYGDTPLDTTGFDGNICAPAQQDCVTLNSSSATVDGNATANIIIWDGQLDAIGNTVDSSNGTQSNQPVWLNPTVQYVLTANDHCTLYNNHVATTMEVGQQVTLNIGTQNYALTANAPFSVTLCVATPQ